METLFFMLDTIALMVVLYFSYRGERDPAHLEQGPFRIREYEKPEPKPEVRRR